MKNQIKEINDKYVLSRIKDVLFIDLDLNMKTNKLAKNLSDYRINVDLAYIGNNPAYKFGNDNLYYRKSIRVLNIEDLIEYINYYNYDVVHLFHCSSELISYLNIKCNSAVVCNNKISVDCLQNINELFMFYIKTKDNIEFNNKIYKRLTIIIPTYNRSEYLKRLLEYLNDYKNIRPNILVLDSSCEESKKINTNIVNIFNNLNIKYIQFDYKIDYFEKINLGIERVKTEYVCLCADDDFIAEEGIEKSLEVLNKDKSLFSVKGKNLYYIQTKDKLKEYDFFTGLYYENPLKRLEKITQGNVVTLIYQVFRTDKFKKLHSFMFINKEKLPNNFIFREYLFYFIVVLTGKIGKINVDFNIRDKGSFSEEYVEHFPHTVLDGTFNKNYIKLKLFLKEYCYMLNIKTQDLDKKIDEIFSSFIINCLGVPKEHVKQIGEEFNLDELEKGMRKSFIWARVNHNYGWR